MTGRALMELAGFVGALAALIAALSLIWQKAIRPILAGFRLAREVLEDMRGTPADPSRGMPARHGVMQRLATIEREVKYNGGSVTLAEAVKNLQQGQRLLEVGRRENADGIARLHNELEAHSTEAAEFLGQALSELAHHGIRITPPLPEQEH